jgi:hypothetical protein
MKKKGDEKMKRTMICMLAMTILTLTLVAATPMQRIGNQLIIPEGTGTLYYYEYFPFHLAHGWSSEIGEPVKTTALGGTRLEIDGVPTPHDFIEYTTVEEEGTKDLAKYFVFNFPTGMNGVHTFDMYYSNICDFWLENGNVEECDKPNEILEFHTKSWEVIFQKPIFIVYTPGSVEGYQWPLGNTITMNVNNGEYIAQSVSEPRPDFPEGETRVLFDNWKDDFMIDPRDYVVLTDETTGSTKSHFVTSVEVTGYDIDAKTISGVYNPAFDLQVFLALSDGTPIETIGVTYDGVNWTAAFNELDSGMLCSAKQFDYDFDGTSWDYWVPGP